MLTHVTHGPLSHTHTKKLFPYHLLAVTVDMPMWRTIDRHGCVVKSVWQLDLAALGELSEAGLVSVALSVEKSRQGS